MPEISWGYTSKGSTEYWCPVTHIYGTKFTLKEECRVESLTVYVKHYGTNPHVKLGIYRVSDGKLMCETDVWFVPEGWDGWKTLNTLTNPVLEPGDYYLCFLVQITSVYAYYSTETGVGIDKDLDYTDDVFPDPLGEVTTTNRKWSIYCTGFGFGAQDPRYRTKVYLETYLDSNNLLCDDRYTSVNYIVTFEDPDYPLIRVFNDKKVDLIFCIGDPETTPLMNADQTPYGYEEIVPITVWCIDKSDIDGEKMKWQAERELRRILETYPYGSLRQLERLRDNDQNLGSTTLYSREFILRYKRSTTV